jgi:phosphatidylserine/phosphatidylglycerophosphate/cardiolipin synthase-like enzyme
MNNTSAGNGTKSLNLKLWRGERMCLLGMNVDNPEPDFVGFSIEVMSPGQADFVALRNRLNFQYTQPASKAVDGNRNFPSIQAPFQKFRWVHFPYDPKGGNYTYRVTKQHMPKDGRIVPGDSATEAIDLTPAIYENILDVGFTRNFASSQAFADKYGANPNIIPPKPADGLKFTKVSGDVYQWLGFEAYELIFNFLNEAVGDKTATLDVLAYDLNEPDIVAELKKLGGRLRIVIDNSKGHQAGSAETRAASILKSSAGAKNVVRMHFHKLQHNKVFILRRAGKPDKVLFGSTNFSFRGLYIQANNALVFNSPGVAGMFEQVFQLAFENPKSFEKNSISTRWQLAQVPGLPTTRFCFSPHSSTDLSMNPVASAIDQASSSVFFAIAFLYQTKSGPVKDAIDRLMKKRLFSYGISDKKGSLVINKPDGTIGTVDFAYLAATAPQPFAAEWSGGSGIHQHDKFVVTDFNLPSAKVFTGSSNLSPSGEKGNGDNLVMIEDSRVATSYAIEAVRIFDHLQFRMLMQQKKNVPKQLVLKKPTAISKKPAWFEPFYKTDSQREKDRLLFSS